MASEVSVTMEAPVVPLVDLKIATAQEAVHLTQLWKMGQVNQIVQILGTKLRLEIARLMAAHLETVQMTVQTQTPHLAMTVPRTIQHQIAHPQPMRLPQRMNQDQQIQMTHLKQTNLLVVVQRRQQDKQLNQLHHQKRHKKSWKQRR